MGCEKFTHLDLFSGIGGFSLGFERTNKIKTVGFCEIDNHAKKILAKHWPSLKLERIGFSMISPTEPCKFF